MFDFAHGCAGVLPVMVCIAVGLLICFLVSRFFCGKFRGGTWGPRGGCASPETASDILKARYARGEIGREEFERIREEIK